MSKTKDIATLGTFANDLAIDAKIDLKDVAAVFVSQYETRLFAKKKDLSSRIKGVKGDLKMLDARVKKAVVKSDYAISVPELGLISKVTDVELKWGKCEDGYDDEDEKIGLTVVIDVSEKVSTRSWGSDSITVRKVIKISLEDRKTHKTWNKELDELNGELLETMALIKGVSRKEREITGIIAGKKLADSGHMDLLDNPDLLRLIEVD